MKKVTYFIYIYACALFIICFSPLNINTSDSCFIGQPLLEQKIIPSNIDKIQVTIGICNPNYGNDSKIITNTSEIENMIEAFNSAEIERKVEELNYIIGSASTYYLFSNNQLIYKFGFNGNDSERIFMNKDLFYIHYYSKNTPYEIYQNSPSEIIAVDDSLNIINR